MSLSLQLSIGDWVAFFNHFLSLSLLAVGGAIITAPDMHRFLVDHNEWLTEQQFSSSIALAQASPGPNVLFVAVIVLIGSAQIFEEPYMLTSGGPVDSSLSISNYLYRVGMQYLRLGYASSVGFLLFVIIFFFSWLQMRLFGVFQED
jgi:protein-S-isoprenylcysteine O-methyltransferase Ste14